MLTKIKVVQGIRRDNIRCIRAATTESTVVIDRVTDASSHVCRRTACGACACACGVGGRRWRRRRRRSWLEFTYVWALLFDVVVNNAAHFSLSVLCVELVNILVHIRIKVSVVHNSTRCPFAFFKTVLGVKVVPNLVGNCKPRFVHNWIQVRDANVPPVVILVVGKSAVLVAKRSDKGDPGRVR